MRTLLDLVGLNVLRPLVTFGGDDSGGGSSGGGSSDSGSSSSSGGSSSSAPAPSKKKDPPSFKNLTEASKAGYHGQAVNIGGKLQKVEFAKGSYNDKMKKVSAAANKKSPSGPPPGSPDYNKTASIPSPTSNKKTSNKKTSGKKTFGGTEYSTGKNTFVDSIMSGDFDAESLLPPTGTDTGDKLSKPYKPPSSISSKAQKNAGYLGVTGDPTNELEEFQKRFYAQSVGAAADPGGASTATGVIVSDAGQKILDDANMTAGEYLDAVQDLGKSLDDPRFGEGTVGQAVGSTLVGQGLDYLADMNKRRAYEQLTGQYDPTIGGKIMGYGSEDVRRVVPVFKDGTIVGSLQVDKDGKAISYTGDRDSSAAPLDPSVSGWENKVAPAPVSSLFADTDDGQGAAVQEVVKDPEDPCPEGYMMDPKTQQCVIDPFQTPFPDPVGGIGIPTPVPNLTPYTQMAPVTLAQLQPSRVANANPLARQQANMPQQGLGTLGSTLRGVFGDDFDKMTGGDMGDRPFTLSPSGNRIS